MLSLPIHLVRRKLQDGLLLPSELCAACISRSERLSNLNAFVRLTKETAARQAKESDARYKNGAARGPLDGIPIAVKDNFCTRGIETTCGSRMLERFVPTYNATVVQRLQDSGCVLVGKTNMDEFGMGSGTIDSIHGATRNVWGSEVGYDLVSRSSRKPHKASERIETEDWFIAGGSSGGSAVAVATGSVYAALGSDTGGSARNPAAYCGLVGLKPTYGLASRHGLIPLVNSMDVPSILTRCVDDAAAVLDAVAGQDDRDSTCVELVARPVRLAEEPDLEGITIGIPIEYHCQGLSEEVVNLWAEVADLLADAGVKVKQVSLPHTQDSIVCYSILNQCEVASNMARYDSIEFGLRPDESRSTEHLYAASRSLGFSDTVRSRILAGNYFLLKDNYERYFVKALKVRRLIAEDFSRAWASGVDVLLTPTTLGDAPRSEAFGRLDNRSQCAVQDYCTQPANMAGCPAVSIPIGLSRQGLPLSLQLIGRNFDEATLLAVAKWVENAVEFPKLEIVD